MHVSARIAIDSLPAAAGARAHPGTGRVGRDAPLTAMRDSLGIVALLLTAAGLAWWITVERMAGMDAGPGSALGSLGWFTGVWATMMAAMMLPSLAPTAAAFAPRARRRLGAVLILTGGYLLAWTAAGVGAYGVFEVGRSAFAGSLAWRGGGRWLAAGALTLAALYQLSALKRASLARCREPSRFAVSSRAETACGAFVLGLHSGAWCIACTWALMAALFALGVMSITWMALIAALVALERIGPWGRGARLASTVVLAALAVAILAVPRNLPAFVVPSSPAHAQMIKAMR